MENEKKVLVDAEEAVATATSVEINTHEGELNQTEFTIQFQSNGYGYCTPVIDGEPCKALAFGYVTESDKKACEKLLREALKATGGNVYKTMSYIQTACKTTEAGIKPSKEVEVEGVKLMISYETNKIYTLNNEELACLPEELTGITLPEEAIDALLVEKAKTAILEERAACSCDCDDCYDDDYDDYDDDEEEDW